MDKIDIYNLFMVFVFSMTISSLFTNSIYRRFYPKMNKAIKWVFFAVFALLIAFSTIEIMNLLEERNSKKLEIKKKRLIEITDSLNKLEVQKKKALEEKERDDMLLKLVQAYFDVDESRNLNNYDTLFRFPVQKYFVISNVSKERVNERIRFAWRRNPPFVFKVSKENTHVDDYGDSVIVLINLTIKNNGMNVIAKIKYDKNLKIYSLNNFYQTQQQTQKILSPNDTIK